LLVCLTLESGLGGISRLIAEAACLGGLNQEGADDGEDEDVCAHVSAILGMSETTAKQHLGTCLQKMGVENRSAAALAAVESLSAGSK
jgi:hypothetical protein